MTDPQAIFTGNRCKITYDGTLYRAFVCDKEVVATSTKEIALDHLQSELSDLLDEGGDDLLELGELSESEEETDEEAADGE